MKFARESVLLLLPLSFSIVLAVVKFLLSPSYDLRELSCCPLFVYAVINAILFAILLLDSNGYRQSSDESKENPSVVLFACEIEEGEQDVISQKLSHGYDEAVGSDEDEYRGFDGYDEDDDNNGSEYEFGWVEEDECDPEFDERIEAFISKVVQGWREERFKGKVSADSYQMVNN